MSKRFIASITLAAFSFLAVPVAALPGSSKLGLVGSSGKVLVEQGGQWSDARQGQLEAGGTLRTGADGAAVVSLPGGSLVRLAPNSQIAFAEAADQGVSIKLERGRMIGSAVRGLQVATDTSIATASNGEFVLATGEEVTLDVVSGDATLKSLTPDAAGAANADLINSPEFKTHQVQKGKRLAQGDDNADENGDDDDDEGGGDFPWAGVGIGLGALITIIIIASQDGKGKDPVPSPSIQ